MFSRCGRSNLFTEGSSFRRFVFGGWCSHTVRSSSRFAICKSQRLCSRGEASCHHPVKCLYGRLQCTGRFEQITIRNDLQCNKLPCFVPEVSKAKSDRFYGNIRWGLSQTFGYCLRAFYCGVCSSAQESASHRLPFAPLKPHNNIFHNNVILHRTSIRPMLAPYARLPLTKVDAEKKP